MFGFLFFALLLISGAPILWKLIKHRFLDADELNISPLSLVLPVLVITIWWIFGKSASLFTDFWWFDSLGRGDVFWTLLVPKFKIFLAVFSSLLILIYAITLRAYRNSLSEEWSRSISALVSFFVSLSFAAFVSSCWEEILMYMNREDSGSVDPMFDLDISFYLFDLPLYDQGLWVIKILLFVIILIHIALLLLKFSDSYDKLTNVIKNTPKTVWICFALMSFVHVIHSEFSIYELMYAEHKIITGINFVGENVQIPVYRAQQIIYSILGVILLIFPFVKGKEKFFDIMTYCSIAIMIGSIIVPLFLGGVIWIWLVCAVITLLIVLIYVYIVRFRLKIEDEVFAPLTLILTIFFVQICVNKVVVPLAVQSVIVAPQEIMYEKENIIRNIESTREAFGLTDQFLTEEVREFDRSLTKEMLQNNRVTVDNARLLDYGATLDVLDKTQSERPYYDFRDVDIDRYEVDGELRQVFVAAREMNQKGLPSASRTYLNQRFIYGHGYGNVMAFGNTFNQNSGYPEFYVKGIPMKDGEPRIYYQETESDGFFYVNSNYGEFDYPQDIEADTSRLDSLSSDVEINKYFYEGSGGVSIGTGMRKLLFSKEYDWRLIFGGAPVNDTTKIMLRRTVKDRLNTLCPFLTWDEDAQYVIRDDGSRVWIANGYSGSTHYPYASKYDEAEWNSDELTSSFGYNYIRHSVKAVVDAYDGTVEFYSFNEDIDPIITTIKNIFPEMFTSLDELPEDLRGHMLFPIRYLKAQAAMHMKYHMDNPNEFYTQENLWRVAYENFNGQRTKMSPRYMLMSNQANQEAELLITIPFTPKEKDSENSRDYLSGWMSGSCDFDDFLKLKIIKYKRGQEVFGPWQTEVQINQQDMISESFTVWGDKGSAVLQGNLQTIPIGNTILYLEPIMIVSQTANGKKELPSIKMIVAVHNKRVAWGRTAQEAINNLMLEVKPQKPSDLSNTISSVYDEYEVMIPVVDGQGNVTSKVVTASSAQEAREEIREAIIQIENAVQILKQAEQSLQNAEANANQ